MNTQHTPGPWNSVATLSSDLYNIRYISGSDCEKVATITHERGMDQDTALANAALIAAAPDLLSNLQLVMDAIQNIPRHKGEQWDDDIRAAYQNCQTAYAKATA